jgi:hypothetical protein
VRADYNHVRIQRRGLIDNHGLGVSTEYLRVGGYPSGLKFFGSRSNIIFQGLSDPFDQRANTPNVRRLDNPQHLDGRTGRPGTGRDFVDRSFTCS